MGKVVSIVARKANRFNAENRAHRFLERDKLGSAPKYEANIKDLERAMKADPDFMEKESKIDKALDDRLKQVYVTSKDTQILYPGRQIDPNRPLPLNRHQVEDFEYGFMEPSKVTRGHCTLRQAIQFLSDSQTNPEIWTKQKIAEEYKIKEETIEKILSYYKMFEVYIPDMKKKENILSQAKPKLLEKE